ncbi:peptidase S46 [Fulvitalea axinellae]|uniref:Dipeptidyl-peptidase n=1 Tax=Fulvitalea axinellae TaxID=1182444 RepID=A0AAU9CHX5_9BACT|nr:peptidase S46 [Fulvitalea axinellae]
MLKRLLIVAVLMATSLSSFADEGMWLPLHIERLYNRDLQKLGLQLTPEEIYSVNHSSLKDAIVSLGGFCTGEMISDQGLMLTNHHCAFGSIQSHSTVDHDYLQDGFWAKTKDDELPNEGLYARFLVRMEDVTKKVSDVLNDKMTAQERGAAIAKISKQLADEAAEGTHYDANVKPFFNGNEFYLFVYETFRDVRLVGAPPSSIGKFGGDTDNWMWPRHTGDFSMFRVYMAPDGKPAKFSKENIPYRPKHHLPVSLDGVREGDFAMIMGFPGSTDRYLTSFGIDLALSKSNEAMIKIMDTRLSTLKKFMNAEQAVRIKYASKYASLSNYWKYLIGQTKGLKRLNVYQQKLDIEKNFDNWVKADPNREKIYGDVLPDYEAAYKGLDAVEIPFRYAAFVSRLMELNGFSGKFARLQATLAEEKPDEEKIAKLTASLKAQAEEFYKNYDERADKAVYEALVKLYYTKIDAKDRPALFEALKAGGFSEEGKKTNEDFKKLTNYVYDNTIFANKDKLFAFLDAPKAGVIENDPVVKGKEAMTAVYMRFVGPYREAYGKLNTSNRLFVKGLREMNPDKLYYPNANSTMRFTYGTVGSYSPADAVHYNYYTTLNGVMQKEDATNPEFVVPAKLKQLYEAKDYGQYADEKGELVVAFLSNNDITGGNSGSPVINGKGHIIGTAFDGNWEAMSGDIAFEPELQRTISVDIRYTLFIIDKYAGAGHLIEEMTLIKGQRDDKKACEFCKGKKCKKCKKKRKKAKKSKKSKK